MKTLRWLALWLAAGTAHAEMAGYTIDPTHTVAVFEVLHQGLSTLQGRFNRQQGSLRFDREGRRGEVEITVDLASVDTGVAARDAWLRSPAFFDTEARPGARFTSDRMVFDGDRVAEVQGTLALAGSSAPLVLKALRFDCYFSPLFRRQVCGGDFEATLQRSRFGLGGRAPVADEVRLRLQIEAVRQ